jgi:hypothetical protein
MRKLILFIGILMLLVPSAVQAVAFYSGDDVIISTAVDDDIFASGGRVSINAPVRSVIAAGGEVAINAAVHGDVIAAGGAITINGPVDGKVVVAGGSLGINANISTNLVAAGGEVTIGKASHIMRDAYIEGGTVTHAGAVGGLLSVSSAEFVNSGTAGSVHYEMTQQDGDGFRFLLDALFLMITIGFYILGILFLWLFPLPFAYVVGEARQNTLKNMLIGLFVILIGCVLFLALAVSVIGLPLALVLGIYLLLGMVLSSLFVASCLGGWILEKLHKETGPYIPFTIGFILIHLLLAIPIIGFLTRVAVVILGTGALSMALWKNRYIAGIHQTEV